MIFSLCGVACDERKKEFFFPSNFHFCPLSLQSPLFFFFSNISSFRKKDTKERRNSFRLSSLFSLKSLSLSPSLSPPLLFLFDERERERKKCVNPFLVFASLREYREREETKL